MPDTPRIFGVPPGVDFPTALVEGLESLLAGAPPEDWARITLILNTRRMARRVRDIFDQGPPRLLPRVLLLGEVEHLLRSAPPPPPASSLRRRLSLTKLIQQLLTQRKDFGAQGSAFDLADSLAALMDEMQGEGVAPETVARLDVSDFSEHFAQTQAFLEIAQTYLKETGTAPDAEARQRDVVLRLTNEWQTQPPEHPIILAGSTASRGTTTLLAEAIARLPEGYVVLPGLDFNMPTPVWDSLSRQTDKYLPAQDHPQFRLQNICARLGLEKADVQRWSDSPPHDEARNKLISLAMRPAPVTDAWRLEGPDLGDLREATKELTLVAAESPRSEAMAIALRLRMAAETGQKAALITPDRMLTRQVAASLDAWNILPDDSAGTPLHLTPIGRFLRHVADLFLRPLTSEALLTLLKHPLTHANETRNQHLLNTRRLERFMRNEGMPFPTADTLAKAGKVLTARHGEDLAPWLEWIAYAFCAKDQSAACSIQEWLEVHETIAANIARNPDRLWNGSDGQSAQSVLQHLKNEADKSDALNARDYTSLIGRLLSQEEVRDAEAPFPGIMIWGTMEARVQGADLVILGSLNDGTWPEQPAPDPWLNRAMRHAAGLMLPDRRIGLSAHDFQQAVAGKEVWLTRAVRNSDAETVPSRWLNRVLNLMFGLPDTQGPQAVTDMQARGDVWLAKVRMYEEPIRAEKAQRPAPQPPVSARPRTLSVSDIRTLVRDPFAIYAKHCLGLKPLGPLVPQADALLRGIAVHQVLEDFVKASLNDNRLLTSQAFLEIGKSVLQDAVPWPAAQALWLARLDRVSDWFVQGETDRQTHATPLLFEDRATAKLPLEDLGMTIKARADRIDENAAGEVTIYDYKTGKPPSKDQQKHFDRQLLIEAAMAEQGAFKALGHRRVLAARYIGMGTTPSVVDAPILEEAPDKVLAELRKLLRAYLDAEQGYTSRRAYLSERDVGDYDLLARFGEWEANSLPNKAKVG